MKLKQSFCLALVIFFCYNSLSQSSPTAAYTSVIGANSEPVIYTELNMNTYDLLSTNIQFSEKNNIQKVVVAPIKFFNGSEDLGFLRETKINIVKKNGITTFGLGIGYDGASIYRKRAGDLFLNMDFGKPLRDKGKNETEVDYQKYREQYYKDQNEVYSNYYEDLLDNTIKFNLGFNISLFEVIGGDKVDLDEDGITDNENTVESYNYSASFTYVFSTKSALSISGHISDKLSSPIGDGQERVLYAGGSLSYAIEIVSINKEYIHTEEFRSSLFKPAILFGFSIEYQEATNNKEFAKDNITKRTVFTPFFDFKINPKTQFRIGVPIQKFEGVNDEVTFGPFAQWTLQIANKN